MNLSGENQQYAVLLEFSRWTDDLVILIPKCIEMIREEIKEMNFSITNWKLEEDELRLLLILRGELNLARNVTEKIRDLLLEKLSKKKIFVRVVIASVLERLWSDPIKMEEYRYMVSLLRAYGSFFRSLVKFGNVVFDFLDGLRKKIVVSLDQENISNSLVEILELSRVIEIVDNDVRINGRGRAILFRKNEIKKIVEQFKKLILEDQKNVLLALSYLAEAEQEYNIFIEIAFSMLDLSIDELFSIIEALKSEGLIIEDNSVSLRGNIRDFYENAIRLILDIENKRASTLENPLTTFMEQVDSRVKYVVLGGGRVEKFSFGRILESMIMAGIPSELATSVIDDLIDLFSARNVVTSEEILIAVKRALNLRDTSGEFAKRYEYFVKTRRFLAVECGNTMFSFTREIVGRIFDSYSKSLFPLIWSQAVKNLIIRTVYDTIRTNYIPRTLRKTYLNSPEILIISKNHIERIIEETLASCIPFYNEIKKSKNIRFGVIDLLNKHIKIIQSLFQSSIQIDHSIEDAIKEFLKGADMFIAITLLTLGYIPGPNLQSNAMILRQISITARKQRHLPVLQYDNQMLKRLEEFARRTFQIAALLHSYRFITREKIQETLSNTAKFGISLINKISKLIS